MKVLLLKEPKLIEHILPNKIEGNYWITDFDTNLDVRNLINVESENNEWFLHSNYETKVIADDIELEKIKLEPYRFYKLRIGDEEKDLMLYCCPTIEPNYKIYKVLSEGKISIGSASESLIQYEILPKLQTQLTYENKTWTIENIEKKINIYVNGVVTTKQTLKYGDGILILGMKITVLKDLIMINEIGNTINVKNSNFELTEITQRPTMETIEESENPLYSKEDYFHRSPRFRSIIEKANIEIDDPPAPPDLRETPIMLTIGPMVTMGMTSLVTATSTLTNVYMNGRSWFQAMPTLAMAIASLGTMLVWPMLTKRYEKKEKKKAEEARQKKYKEYIDSKRAEIDRIIKEQSGILRENYFDLDECKNIVLSRKNNFWERGIDQNDFLSVRLGLGNTPVVADIKYPEQHFVMNEDNLKVIIQEIVNERKELENVPIAVSLTEKYITAVIADNSTRKQFMNGVILQLIAFHSYEFLKIVIITNKENEEKWENMKALPYCWNDAKTERYFATTVDEAREVSLNLERDFQRREAKEKSNYKQYKPYYLIITDNYEEMRDIDIIKDTLSQKTNVGFGIIMLSNTIVGLPSECQNFISIGQKTSGTFESELTSDKQKEFKADFFNGDIEPCYKAVENVPLEIESEESSLPNSLSFLGMYGVGKIEQLNLITRWGMNNSTSSLAAIVGVDKNSLPIKLDLHEKYHGPHGLIAGMTGSGKSEFIITYILSMAVNYTPEEVAFILIDYKGGGLARVFENKETKKKLPHIAGTITNLDTNEISRALASIQSELRRRQQIFNEAREITGESTVDIYKYQKFYKQGKVKEPVPHLLIISDEFAELKTDQPEFMDKLISTARIGRSLGVHLVLATQKPAGIVNDQIWSNSRFRVCLKVQDKTDSQDMIKCPDAATLRNAGRFYLQVGYNELFILGQSGYCGSPYFPTEKLKKKVDKAITFVNNVGNITGSYEMEDQSTQKQSLGEELGNLIDYIIGTAKQLNMSAKQLWLDKIPDKIFVDDLAKTYEYKEQPYDINPIIGEFDDPGNQRHGLVTLPITKNGNTIIYGAPDSGKELVLSTIVLNTAKNHSPEEVNFYLIDFGTETLNKYKKLPHVGDVILANNEEKLANLFKKISSEIEKRKKLFVDYNGDYELYIKNSQTKLPNIIIVINGYEAFVESYDAINEQLSIISRESAKYGIAIITTLTGSLTMRTKIKQNFGQSVLLRMTTKDDYSYILGGRCHIQPSEIEGRGLVKYDGIYEFQAARVYNDEEINEKTNQLAQELNDKYQMKVEEIRVLPEQVTKEILKPYLKTMADVPIGISYSNLDITKYDFKKSPCNLIMGNDLEEMKSFTNSLCNLLTEMPNVTLYVVDAISVLKESHKNYQYYSENIDEVVNKLFEVTNFMIAKCNENDGDKSCLKQYKDYVIVIIGISEMKTILNTENQGRLSLLFELCKTIGKINYIMVETIDNIKKIEYDNWYKTVTNRSQYIWYGNGISDQFIFKYGTKPRRLLEPSFGLVTKGSKTEIVKLIEDEKGANDNGQ